MHYFEVVIEFLWLFKFLNGTLCILKHFLFYKNQLKSWFVAIQKCLQGQGNSINIRYRKWINVKITRFVRICKFN